MGDMKKVGQKSKDNKLLQWIYNVVVSTSDLLYTLLGGSPRVSLSQMLGYRKATNRETWWSKPIRVTVDFAFRTLLNEKNHCQESVVGESNVRGLYEIDKELALFLSKRTISLIQHEQIPGISTDKASPE